MPRTSFTTVEVEVKGSKGDEYWVLIVGDFPTGCTCPSYKHRNGPAGTMCKHMVERSGQKAVGVTRCARCRAWLTPAEISGQPKPGSADLAHDQSLSRLCDACRSAG